MLVGKGFRKVFNVSGGIKAWDAKVAVGAPDLGMDLFTGNESPADVLKTAYSLEQGLRDFYLHMEKKSENTEVKKLFSKLAEIEIKHQESILAAYNQLAAESLGREAFEARVEGSALEGGLSTDEYLALFKPDLGSPVEVVSLAMSIEAQALDLYQRAAKTFENPESRAAVRKIADEEKVHLSRLGELMERLKGSFE